MTTPTPGSQAWLDLAREPAIDPERPIIDPHHHLWLAGTPGAPWPAGMAPAARAGPESGGPVPGPV